MIRVLMLAAAVSTGLMAAVIVPAAPVGVQDPQLAGTWGGGPAPACSRAGVDTGACQSQNFTKCVADPNQAGHSLKKVYTGQTEAFCNTNLNGNTGRTGCVVDTPKLCYTEYACTDENCNSCSATGSGTTSVNTNLTLSGDVCPTPP